MLDEWAKYQLKLNHINEDDVEEMSTDFVVTFKDGTKRRVCQVYSRVMGYIRPTTDYNVGKYSAKFNLKPGNYTYSVKSGSSDVTEGVTLVEVSAFA